MNNRQLYLAWLRTAAPTVYASAVRKATGQIRSTGGLTDDLVQQSFASNLKHSFLGDDTSYMDTTFMDYGQSDAVPIDNSISLPPINFQTPTFDASSLPPLTFANQPGSLTPSFSPAPSAPGSTFSNILSAVTAIGAGVINATNQNKLISLNTTRAQQGLPPVDANGRVVVPAGTSATGSALLAFERSISGGGSSMLPIILGALGLGAFFLFSKRSAN